ncbi:hypothetical protein DPMN_101018 [Dreissena polymorpha]|uniref:Uncharacterized protein n=1 Tax=Dreissena polymorpha TaxID=45954 RepID=A0A9D4CIB7_DREPO|nr:hypothetical protein DPMN_051701 [Dreissena polymorpha]KAH3858392.1 hypothetical protein DPMN_101016 [Dreissena polymorpha]KAH3858393.1 hypothetical protein DPMN_101017 [Dreissena polymorpha]KAH3858394.1 hypothetical protein DPMN_101018 [Dreissena polymorpha]
MVSIPITVTLCNKTDSLVVSLYRGICGYRRCTGWRLPLVIDYVLCLGKAHVRFRVVKIKCYIALEM